MRAPACDPTATTSLPTFVTWPSVCVMPRALAATVKSWPASVAGGKPRAAADGAGPALPLFTPVSTTTATPKTTMARIGIATRTPQPRNCRPAMNSRDQRRLTGSGTSERTSLVHSAPAAFTSGRARPRSVTTWRGGRGRVGCGPESGVRAGCGPVREGAVRKDADPKGAVAAGGALIGGGLTGRGPDGWRLGGAGGASPGQACGGTGSGWLTVGVYRNRRGWLGASGDPLSRTTSRGPLSRRTSRGPGSRRTAWGPGSRRTAWGPGSRRTAWGPGSRRTAWGPVWRGSGGGTGGRGGVPGRAGERDAGGVLRPRRGGGAGRRAAAPRPGRAGGLAVAPGPGRAGSGGPR